MNSQDISDAIYAWALNRPDFTAPYGVIQGQHVSARGRKYHAVTFGRCRTLDATVEIYNRNWIVVRTSTWASQVCRSYSEVMQLLETL